MLDNKKISAFIADKRKQKGLTQREVADALNISFQAVSKWENGVAYPTIELLYDLSQILGITTDEILNAKEADNTGLSYSRSGVDIAYTDTIKNEMAEYIKSDNPRVLNGLGSFASLYDINFDEIKNPVLVLKAEEPGSKQKLAIKYGYTESICHDMINHLVNDIIVMGARPLAVLDTIICGNAEKDTIKSLVKGISEACHNNECSLVGGETSIQPSVIEKGVYLLASSIAGIVDRDSVIDGSKIVSGDRVIAVSSNGLHTNGYSLVRLLMEEMPQIRQGKIGDETFVEAIMKPHTAYYKAIKGLFGNPAIHGMAHITGGGIEGNLSRIIPEGSSADIDLSTVKTLPVFKCIKENGNITDSEMLRTFNCGVGMIIVAESRFGQIIIDYVSKYFRCYEIGEIIGNGESPVSFKGKLHW